MKVNAEIMFIRNALIVFGCLFSFHVNASDGEFSPRLSGDSLWPFYEDDSYFFGNDFSDSFYDWPRDGVETASSGEKEPFEFSPWSWEATTSPQRYNFEFQEKDPFGGDSSFYSPQSLSHASSLQAQTSSSSSQLFHSQTPPAILPPADFPTSEQVCSKQDFKRVRDNEEPETPSIPKPKTKKPRRVNNNRTGIPDSALKILLLERENRTIAPIDVAESTYQEFMSRFPFTLTDDQISAIKAIADDFKKGLPMYRIVTGDVGFGKTEVALHAAFLIAKSGKKVFMIAPNKALALQHFNSFRERTNGLGVNVHLIPAKGANGYGKKKQEIMIKRLGSEYDSGIYISTHALLSEDYRDTKNLGLLIIDEEHKFGVKQKEAIRNEHMAAHVLWMTATPIPRTFGLITTGNAVEVSRLETPPSGRRNVITEIIEDEDSIISKCIQKEIERNGNVFFLAPTIAAIDEIVPRLKQFFSEEDILIAHGKMKGEELAENMALFRTSTRKILVATTVIETGIDVSHANTIIIYQPKTLRISSLHQLRGRVGRGQEQAYCYVVAYEAKSKTALTKDRVDAFVSTPSLGGGYSLSKLDSDMRGTGNIFGGEQKGHIGHDARGLLMEFKKAGGSQE